MRIDALDAFRLDGRTAVVTGAASGIGEATAELFAAAGAFVVCGDVDEAGSERTVARIAGDGGRAAALPCDVTRRADVDALVERAQAETGRVDVVANVAGAMFAGRIEDLSDDAIDAGIALNLKSVLYGCQAAIRAMKDAGSGVIINVASGAIDKPFPGVGVYAFTKSAVAMLGRTLSLEVGEYGIRVVTIAPGTTLTNFTKWRIDDGDSAAQQRAYEEFLEQQRALSPLGAIGEAIDQAYLMLYLASDAGRFAAGNVFRANGGQVLI